MKSKKQYFKLKRILIVLLILIIAFFTYVEMANSSSKNMTYRQKILKAVYPAFMWITKLTGTNAAALSGSKEPPVSFYTQKAILNNGDTLNLASLKGKKVLLVKNG